MVVAVRQKEARLCLGHCSERAAHAGHRVRAVLLRLRGRSAQTQLLRRIGTTLHVSVRTQASSL
eukprot:3637951-Rhodomonas_salina.1